MPCCGHTRVQRAEVAVYFKRFDEAEQAYQRMDRPDLAIDMRMRLGDWFKVRAARSSTLRPAVGCVLLCCGCPPPAVPAWHMAARHVILMHQQARSRYVAVVPHTLPAAVVTATV